MDAGSKTKSPGAIGFRDCDTDNDQLNSGICSAILPATPFFAQTCSDPSIVSFPQTLTLPDMRCPGEDRLIGCEILAVEGEKYDDGMRDQLFGRSAFYSKV